MRNLMMLAIAGCLMSFTTIARAEEDGKPLVQGELPQTMVIQVQKEKTGKESSPVVFLIEYNKKITNEQTAQEANKLLQNVQGKPIEMQEVSGQGRPEPVSQLFTQVSQKPVLEEPRPSDNLLGRWFSHRNYGNYSWYGHGYQPYYGYYSSYSPGYYGNYGLYYNGSLYPYTYSNYSYSSEPYTYYYYSNPCCSQQ